ncbi:MAG: ABC transporter substrate-binding protein [Syntrophorhabdales bacterium]|jgi:branched-chain amino acid transport system substrate-binding protein
MKKLLSVITVSCALSVVVLFPLASSFAKEPAGEAKTLKIGVITSITGPIAPALKALADAAKPAQDLMNQRGGITIKGQKYLIELVVEDDQSSPPGGIGAANKLIQAGVKFIIAPQFPPTNLALGPITEEAKVIRMKGMGIGKEEMPPQMRYNFYGTATILNIPTCYDYLTKNYPKVKKIAFVTPDDPGIGSNREATEKEAKKRGLEIVFQEAFKIGSEDFYPILTKALEKKPDAIDMIVAIPLWSSGIVNQSRELGFNGPIFTAMLGDIHILNSMLNQKYAYDVFHAGADVLSPQMMPIVRDYRVLIEKQLKTTFNMDHALLIEGLYPLLQGIEKAQSFDTDKVAATLENMKKIDTIYGPGRMGGQDVFGINHVVYRPPMISRIANGKIEFEFVKQ